MFHFVITQNEILFRIFKNTYGITLVFTLLVQVKTSSMETRIPPSTSKSLVELTWSELHRLRVHQADHKRSCCRSRRKWQKLWTLCPHPARPDETSLHYESFPPIALDACNIPVEITTEKAIQLKQFYWNLQWCFPIFWVFVSWNIWQNKYNFLAS